MHSGEIMLSVHFDSVHLKRRTHLLVLLDAGGVCFKTNNSREQGGREEKSVLVRDI